MELASSEPGKIQWNTFIMNPFPFNKVNQMSQPISYLLHVLLWPVERISVHEYSCWANKLDGFTRPKWPLLKFSKIEWWTTIGLRKPRDIVQCMGVHLTTAILPHCKLQNGAFRLPSQHSTKWQSLIHADSVFALHKPLISGLAQFSPC